MGWIAPRSRREKVREAAQATVFAARHGKVGHPVRLRSSWLYSRLNLVPTTVSLQSGPILDVGANVGDWTAAVLHLVPQARVLAFEPAPAVLPELRARFAADPRVTVHEVGISNSDAGARFHVTAHSHNSSLLQARDMNAEYAVTTGWEEVEEIHVPTQTLDAFLDPARPPSLVKIDVQGAELGVLTGGRRTLSLARAVLIEVSERSHYVADALPSEVDTELAALGYEQVGRSDPWLDAVSGEVLWYDACYVRP